MFKFLVNLAFGKGFVKKLRPLRSSLNRRFPVYAHIDQVLVRFVARRLESGFSERLIASGQVGNGHLGLINWRLWSGHSVRAIQIFERIIASEPCDNDTRADAAMYLAAWYSANGQCLKSLQMQEKATELLPSICESNTFVLLKIDNLIDCGRQPQLNNYVTQLLSRKARNDHHVQWALINAVSQGKSSHDSESKDWFSAVNECFARAGVSGIDRKHPDRALTIANLTPSSAPISGDASSVTEEKHPLITVIVPAYNAADRIAVALESLQSQTWSNIEVLVVDDCSTDSTKDVVLRYSAADQRIKYLALPKNQGSYSARNHGLKYAQGEFITTHDIDDWSHPDKLREQAAHLMESNSSVGNLSMAVRCTETMRFLGNWRPNGILLKENLSSFMFRRTILPQVGEWDAVRIGGDSEFINRVKLFFGDNSLAVVMPNIPLSFVLGDHDSLTSAGATHIRTFYYGVRREYAAMSRFWHETLRENRQMVGRPAASVPPMIRPDRSRQTTLRAVVLLDAVNDLDAVRFTESLLENERLDGAVGVYHWPEFGKPREPDIDGRLRRLAFEGQIEVLVPGQQVKAEKIFIASKSNWASKPDSYPAFVIDSNEVVLWRDGTSCDTNALGLPEDMIVTKSRDSKDAREVSL